jgi:hypothetical protein
MGRQSTLPTLFEEKKSISIKKLKEYGYLNDLENKHGGLEWSRNGEVYSSIGIRSDIEEDYSCIILDYTKSEQHFKYSIDLERVQSNLGKGTIFYFICPLTKKRCRKLYLIGDHFAHRTAYQNIYYEKQTYSKRSRDLDRFYTTFHASEKAQLEIDSKHFKKFYKGQPTKRYKRLFSIVQRCMNYTKNDYYRSCP